MPASDSGLPIWDAIVDAGASIGEAADGAAAGVHDAAQDAAGPLVGTAISGVATTSQAVSAGGAAMAVTFADIEAMTASIQSLNQVVVPIIGSVAALAVDGDLLESLILSPGTGASAEAAALLAATQLSGKLVVFEGLALVTATVVSTYQLADNALQASAAAIGGAVDTGGAIFGAGIAVGGAAVSGAVDVVGSVLTGAGDVVVEAGKSIAAAERLVVLGLGLAGVAAGSYLAGVEEELEDTFWGAVGDAADKFQEDPWGTILGGGVPLVIEAGRSIGDNFSVNDMFANGAENIGDVLGATGPLYDDILEAIIHDGQQLGLFNDGEATLGKAPISAGELTRRIENSVTDSNLLVRGSNGAGPGGFDVDTENRIVPTDVSSLFASAKQIDVMGDEDFANIRILENVVAVEGPPGTFVEKRSYTVQIPSTLVWNPLAGAAPNDVTADLLAMNGDQTALMNAVYDAMEEQGIDTNSVGTTDGPPVMLVGFSLGGITAASMAADPRGFNIQQVVTAGSPISEIAIPAGVDVTALQAKQDIVPETSGGTNPEQWNTIRQDGAPYVGEDDWTSVNLNPLAAHNADRYAVMAANNSEEVDSDEITAFLSGSVTVHDYSATRE
jgi:hypothetical protein